LLKEDAVGKWKSCEGEGVKRGTCRYEGVVQGGGTTWRRVRGKVDNDNGEVVWVIDIVSSR
jgi:hypothetical protein